MNIRRWLYLVVILSIGLSACTTPTPAPTSPATPQPTSSTGVPRFESTDCWFEVPQGQTADCGYLIVPEDRTRSDDLKMIKVAVARFKSEASSPAPDPIVYLEGGPGGSPLRSTIEQFSQVFAPLLEKRDLILVDQRGTGYSQPALNCPEFKDWAFSVLDKDLSIEESEKQSNAILVECRNRLASQDVNLAAFNSAENAADLNDLRVALGIEAWNLYGISYGTRLALTILRDSPQGIRSVVIDSVVPLQIDLYTTLSSNGARAFDVLAQACAADAACSGMFPDFRQEFFDLVQQLNEEPVTFPITLKSGEKQDMLLNGDSLLGVTFQYLYITSILPFLPRLLDDVRNGNYALIGYLQGQLMSQYDEISYGMHFSVQCDEEVPFGTLDQIDAAIQQFPDFRVLASRDIFNLCNAWGVGPAGAVEDQPVTSDVPTLVLSGQFDPITPPEWGQLAAQTLSQSVFIELPNAGHGASLTGGDCPRNIVLAFFDDPTAKPDDSCIAPEMGTLTFVPPANAVQIDLVPFTESSMGFSSVRPDGWPSVGPGAYTPTGSLTDQTALVQQAAPVAPDMVLRLMESQFEQAGAKAKFEQVGTRQANGLDWILYRADISIIGVDMAVAESGGTTYLVLMQSLIDERDSLTDVLFLPVVDALKPAQ